MHIRNYQLFSKRTAPFNADPQNNQEFLNFLGNYSMGLVGEWFEYQVAINNTGKVLSNSEIDAVESEMGDVMHYAVNLLTALGEEYNVAFLSEEAPNYKDLDVAFVDILEIPKKHIYHGHELQKKSFIAAVYVIISHFAMTYPTTLQIALKKNIEKLSIRYPEKFTTEDSIARVDVK